MKIIIDGLGRMGGQVPMPDEILAQLERYAQPMPLAPIGAALARVPWQEGRR